MEVAPVVICDLVAWKFSGSSRNAVELLECSIIDHKLVGCGCAVIRARHGRGMLCTSPNTRRVWTSTDGAVIRRSS